MGGINPHPPRLSILLSEHIEEGIFALNNRADSVGGMDTDRLQFAHQQQPENLVEIASGQDNAFDRGVPETAGVQLWSRFNLCAQIGRGVQQEPMLIVGGDGNLDLRPGRGVQQTPSLTAAVRATAIPLWKAAAGRRTQNFNSHCRLNFGRRVAVDFASHGDLFEVRCFPLHDSFLVIRE
jgi:hypothetical protein